MALHACTPLLAVVLTGTAAGHVPHDTVVAVAPPPDLVDSEPWYLVANPYENTLLLQSDQGGQGWYHVGGDPIGDDPLGAAQLDDGTLAILTNDRLWWQDQGSWSADELPGTLTALVPDGDRLFLAGGAGLWSWTVTDGFSEELTDRVFERLGMGPVAVDRTHEVWFLDGDVWSSEPAPAEPRAVLDTGEVFLADLDGQI